MPKYTPCLIFYGLFPAGRLGVKAKSTKKNLPDSASAAEKLNKAKGVVLQKWESAIRSKVPAANGQSTSELRDHLPQLITQIVHALSVNSSSQSLKAAENRTAEEHGEERAGNSGYSLNQMIWEYQILRRIVFAELEKKTQLSPRDRDIILETLQFAIRKAADRFNEIRSDQKEKVFNRRILETEKLHDLLIESLNDYAIFTLDPGGFITTWNPGCIRMQQYAVAEAIGRHYEMLFPLEGRLRNEPMDHLKAALIEGQFRGEGYRIRKDGSRFFCSTTITPIYWEGHHVGFGNVVENLDERNQLIQERDISKTEAEELKLEKDLKESFISALTHDLRTPIAAAQISAQLISRNKQTLPQNDTLARRIYDSMVRMDEMIQDLLDSSRIKAGERLHVNIVECNLRDIALDVQRELSMIHGDRFQIFSDGPTVGFWSPEGLRRILENLMTNAIKYGREDTKITVGIKNVNIRILLTVHNFGASISLEDQLVLFEPFHRTASAVTSNRKGWGLGLTLVRGLAESNGGTVKVESYPKEGTRFTVDLPLDARPYQESLKKQS